MKRWIVGVTGASGIRYGLRVIEQLAQEIDEVHVVFSEAAIRVLHDEENLKVSATSLHSVINTTGKARIVIHHARDIGASIASGSLITEGMVIVPCSMATLGALAHGTAQNLVHRAAEVVLKEGRRLVIVPRETPLSTIHIENMAILSRLGVRVVPAMPGFYHQPQSIEDLVNMMVMKILDQMDIHLDLVERWKGKDPA